MLALLLLNANRVVSTERLIDDLWGDSPPSTARAALQVYVAGLRKALGAGGATLRTRAPGYVLEVKKVRSTWIALSSYALMRMSLPTLSVAPPCCTKPSSSGGMSRCRSCGPNRSRAPPSHSSSSCDCARSKSESMPISHLAAMPPRDRARGAGRGASLPGGAPCAADAHPLPLRPTGGALDVYQAGRRALQDDLGLEPGKELRDLEAAILRQDEALSVARSVPAEPKPNRTASAGGSPFAAGGHRSVHRRLHCRRARYGPRRPSFGPGERRANRTGIGRRRRSRQSRGRRRGPARVQLSSDRRRRRLRLAGRSEGEHTGEDRPGDERPRLAAAWHSRRWVPDRAGRGRGIRLDRPQRRTRSQRARGGAGARRVAPTDRPRTKGMRCSPSRSIRSSSPLAAAPSGPWTEDGANSCASIRRRVCPKLLADGFGGSSSIAVTSDAVWLGGPDGVVKLDPRTGQELGRTPVEQVRESLTTSIAVGHERRLVASANRAHGSGAYIPEACWSWTPTRSAKARAPSPSTRTGRCGSRAALSASLARLNPATSDVESVEVGATSLGLVSGFGRIWTSPGAAAG